MTARPHPLLAGSKRETEFVYVYVWENMVSLLFQNGDTKYHVLVSQTGRINRLDVFYQLDFIDFIW